MTNASMKTLPSTVHRSSMNMQSILDSRKSSATNMKAIVSALNDKPGSRMNGELKISGTKELVSSKLSRSTKKQVKSFLVTKP